MAGKLLKLRPGAAYQVCHQPGRAPTLVFIHGGLGNRYNWRPQYEHFANQGQAVLAYDLAGHGQSSPARRYSLGRHRRDLRRLLRRFQISHPLLCCHSYGVPLGLEWIQHHPASGLLLIAGGTHGLTPWWEIPLIKFLGWGGRHLYRLPGLQALTDRVSSAHQHETVQTFQAESPMPLQEHAYRMIESFWGYDFFARHPQPVRFSGPVVVMSGGQDPAFTQAMGEALARCFVHGQHWHLPDAGHLIMAEYPAVVNAAIAQLIQAASNAVSNSK